MNWIAFAFIGAIAQLIDGALGMGFGLTSSSLLITLGASAALASAAVHAAEMCTTLASGLSHWHAENDGHGRCGQQHCSQLRKDQQDYRSDRKDCQQDQLVVAECCH